MKTRHRIIIGDARNMDEVADGSVNLIVTSPPYWQLKDYGNSGQIGFDDSYEQYINNLNLVWQESYRVLENGCRLCVNIGDQFARSIYYGRYKVIPIRTEIIKFCEIIGFDYMGAIIWQKVTTTNTTGGATIMGSFPYPRNGILKIDYEFILLFKKGGQPRKVDKEIKLLSKLSKDEWNEYFSGHWNFPGEKQAKHLAMYPLELPTRLIKMFTFVGETVLDPFLGSGTTSLAARNLNRNSVGFEINDEFIPLISRKLGIDEEEQSNDCSLVVERESKPQLDIARRIRELPYVFQDPVRIDRTMDPKKNRCGSRIDKESKNDITYYNVKKVISPNVLKLNNGTMIKLIGIRVLEDKKTEAMEFIRKKTKGQRVFLRFDDQRYDGHDNMLCYLYLKNKAFVNAHLIKANLVGVETRSEYRYKTKFIRYVRESQGTEAGKGAAG